MSRTITALDDRLFLPSLQAPEMDDRTLRQHVAELERAYEAAKEEINLLTSERDELVAAIKKWAKADRLERQELLLEASAQDLRSELKQLRSENRRLKRENTVLQGDRHEDQRRMCA